MIAMALRGGGRIKNRRGELLRARSDQITTRIFKVLGKDFPARGSFRENKLVEEDPLDPLSLSPPKSFLVPSRTKLPHRRRRRRRGADEADEEDRHHNDNKERAGPSPSEGAHQCAQDGKEEGARCGEPEHGFVDIVAQVRGNVGNCGTGVTAT